MFYTKLIKWIEAKAAGIEPSNESYPEPSLELDLELLYGLSGRLLIKLEEGARVPELAQVWEQCLLSERWSQAAYLLLHPEFKEREAGLEALKHAFKGTHHPDYWGYHHKLMRAQGMVWWPQYGRLQGLSCCLEAFGSVIAAQVTHNPILSSGSISLWAKSQEGLDDVEAWLDQRMADWNWRRGRRVVSPLAHGLYHIDWTLKDDWVPTVICDTCGHVPEGPITQAESICLMHYCDYNSCMGAYVPTSCSPWLVYSKGKKFALAQIRGEAAEIHDERGRIITAKRELKQWRCLGRAIYTDVEDLTTGEKP